jgi:eukaryotic-like serine/threonine-protein kinase
MDQERWRALKNIFWAAADCEPGTRAAYIEKACGDDTELRAEIESLLAAHAVNDGFIEQPASRHSLGLWKAEDGPSWIGRRLGSYRIVEEIGRGGMSEVYKAVRDDDEYHKEVAIKVLRGGYYSASLLDRFKIEKQILATLDHPNIARLLDGGSTDEGLPYLVMDYICGQPIDDYVTHHNLALSQRIDLFRTLCAAVQYVHQHLMVHGDLKCSNVLVADDGTVKLLDFGIAKLLNPTPALPSADPLTVALALTPEYASPEQIRGGPITTVSDVYSLGVVLYRLLTGVVPYPLSNEFSYELATRICETEPLPPSVAARANETAQHPGVWQHLSGDVDNIVLMALQKDPANRYASVEQLNEDLRRYLHGFPVAARPASVPYRVGKFLSRHKAGLAAASVLVLTLIGGIVATSRQAHIADLERARAERHFEDVRKLANTFMFDVEESIKNLPGATPARQMLVANALKYLDGLSVEAPSNLPLQRELATAYEKVADIQGGFLQANLGNAPDAILSYRKAAGIRTALIAADPSAQDVRRDLLRNFGKLSELLYGTGDPQAAIEISRHLLEQAQTLVAAPNSTAADRHNLGNAKFSLGWLAARSGEIDRGLLLLNESIDIYQELLASNSQDMRARRAWALACVRTGEVMLNFADRVADGLRMQRKGFDVVHAMADADPDNADLKKIEAYALIGIGDAMGRQGDSRAALDQHLHAVSMLRALHDADPKDDEARFDFGLALGAASETLLALGELHSAESDLREAIDALSRSGDAGESGLNRVRVALGIDYFRLGRASALRAVSAPSRSSEKLRDCQQARQWFERSAPILKAADSDDQWRAYTAGRAGLLATELDGCPTTN